MPLTTLRVRRISLPKMRLSGLSSAERNFLFLGGHILNELNSLNKVFMWCLNGRGRDRTSKITSLAQGVQSMVYARVLAGKLLEAWNALDPAWFGSRLSLNIEPRLHPDAIASLSVLKRYFSRMNPIFRVRNSFAFHYSAEELGANWEEAAQRAELEVVLGGTIGNNLHLAAELVANAAVLKAVNPTNPEVGFQTFLDDVQTMTSHFTTFLEGAAIVLLETTLGGKLADHGREEELHVQQSYSEVQLPYFCAPDASKGATRV
jgi:hypothetical protein